MFFRIGLKRIVFQVASIIIFIFTWGTLIRLTNNIFIPGPIACAIAFWELFSSGILYSDSVASITRVLVGFLLATIIGISSGFLIGGISVLRQLFSPVLELLRPIPPIAWIPIAITLFGIGDSSSYFVIFIGAFYPVFTNTALGVTEVSQIYLDVSKSLGISRWNSYVNVILPSSLPNIFTGMRIGLGFAWMCVIAAEMIAARSGLGYEIQLNRQLLRLDFVIVGMVTIGIIGVLMSYSMFFLEWLLIPWRRSKTFALPNIHDQKNHNNQDFFSSFAPKLKGSSVEIKNLSFLYTSDSYIIKNLSIDIKAGEVFCILGASGCGKTTLLRILAGLESPTSGKITFNKNTFEKNENRVTMVFQSSALFPWKTTLENIEFAMQKSSFATSKNSAAFFLEMVDLKNKANFYPHQLSGGQQQRVGVARALANAPSVLLMDEPFAALDSLTRETLQGDMSQLFASIGITVVLVTHNISEALFMSDRIAVMSPNEGVLLKEIIVPFPRPRDNSFRHLSEVNGLRQQLWYLLHNNLSE